MIGKTEIAQAVCDSDAHTEEYPDDYPAFWRTLGVDLDGLTAVAHQRALRMCMSMDGHPPMNWGEGARTVALTPESAALLPMFAALFMDGFAAGVKVKA